MDRDTHSPVPPPPCPAAWPAASAASSTRGPHSYHLVGVGGSGMASLALLLLAAGHRVGGSDRSHDAGRSPDRFAALADAGVTLSPQDGSGVTSSAQLIVASAAVEASVPDIARATALGCRRMTRAELNADLFNHAAVPIGIAGTSGKSTVTAMTGLILSIAGRDPTIMNGAGMIDFGGDSARAGAGPAHVSEIDESDGSIILYRPAVGVLLNCTLDHKAMDELRRLFRDFAAASRTIVWNADDPELAPLVADHPAARPFGFGDAARGGVRAVDLAGTAKGSTATVLVDGRAHALGLAVPGRHNVANALAAIAAAMCVGVPPADACAALGRYRGIARRFQTIGQAHGVTVIDDFAHNPDKIAATMAVLAGQPGRRHWLFQPHGYGPLARMTPELADAFAAAMDGGDRLIVTDPAYFGGSVDRTVGSADLVAAIVARGGQASHVPVRDDAAGVIAAAVRPGDSVVVMGARDDTLPGFARAILDRIACHGPGDRA